MGIAMNSELLNVIPVWCFFPLTAAIGLMTLEAGYRAGKWHHRHAPDEKETSVATMVASLLGLLAFLLAFTFSPNLNPISAGDLRKEPAFCRLKVAKEADLKCMVSGTCGRIR
jgi:hypothetical protein